MPVFWKLLWAHMHKAAIYCGRWRGAYKQNGCLYRGFKADPPDITKVPETVPKSYVVWSLHPGDSRGSGWAEVPVTGYPGSRCIGFPHCPRPAPAAAIDHGIYKQIQLDRGVRDRLDSVGRRSRGPERSRESLNVRPEAEGAWPRTTFRQSNECDACTRSHIFEGSVPQL